MTEVCPECEVDVQEKDLIGINVRGVYDGVLLWMHDCGSMWPRFETGHLNDKAVEFLERQSQGFA